jgi:hypothetical protein
VDHKAPLMLAQMGITIEQVHAALDEIESPERYNRVGRPSRAKSRTRASQPCT